MGRYSYSDFYKQVWGHDDSDAHFDVVASYFAEKLQPLLPADLAAAVLEVGCGMGFAIAGLQRLGYTNTKGMDANDGQVEAARRRNSPVQKVTIEDYPSFMAAHHEACDAILALDVLEHVPTAQRHPFLQAIYRAVKPGGRFICQVPNANSTVAARYRYGDPSHETSFAEPSLEAVLRFAGFERVVIYEADPNRFPRNPKRWPWWAFVGAIRAFRRLELVAEIGGGREAWNAPLTPNIIALGHKKQLSARASAE
jgi:SAM-dependent methyltransferase